MVDSSQKRSRVARLSLVVLVLVVLALAAQDTATSPTPPPRGSIGGVVRDAATGAPMEGVLLFASGAPNSVQAKTDAEGRYTFRDLEPGQYLLGAYTRTSWGTKAVTLRAGQELDSVEFRLVAFGVVAGTVFDDGKEPLPGIRMWLVHRQYFLGGLRYTLAGATTTDDKGEYRLTSAMPGRAYLVLAENRASSIDANSSVPIDPKSRMPEISTTYYPDSTSVDGAQSIVLRAGETREGVDVRMARSPSYCMEGTLDAGGAATFFLVPKQFPTSGAGGFVGGISVSAPPPSGKTGPDGKIRVCGLRPGEYDLTATNSAGNSMNRFAKMPVIIGDEDVRNIRLVAQSGVPLSGQVVWEGPASGTAVESKVSIALAPLNRPSLGGEQLAAQSSIPGEFSYPGLLMDAYAVRVSGLPRSLYVRDVTYAGRSVMLEPLQLGSAIGNAELRVIVARDGGFLSVRVNDKDGKPVPNPNVFVMPAGASSEVELASLISYGMADQNGRYESRALPPGKYFVLASSLPLDTSPETIGMLLRAKTRAKEVDISAGATAQVAVEHIEM
jgi:protocatechuate 3,4-dioxygenase beta subunit